MAAPRELLRAHLAPEPASVPRIRHLLRNAAEVMSLDVAQDVELLLSELVTNALVHAATPIDVTIVLEPAGVRVLVADGNHHLPAVRNYSTAAGTGRGMRLLKEVATSWGVERRPGGKAVWFMIGGRRSLDLHRSSAPEVVTSAEAGDGVSIELLSVPLLLHAAWHQHAETLLREHLLARIDQDLTDRVNHAGHVGHVDAIQQHAQASEALALLSEQIPVPDVGDDPERLMTKATEPYVTRDRVCLTIPAPAVPNFATLDRLLEEALVEARAGTFLTAPTQPELLALRTWLCAQVADQAGGAAPRPWDGRPGLESMPEAPRRAPVPIGQADGAAVAADDTGRIFATNPAALDLLGYSDPAELVGERLVVIIPPRLRQAHVAGFTLYLLNERGPLLDREVTVPAYRRDHTEVEIRLRVRAVPTPTGRVVFVADLRPVSR